MATFRPISTPVPRPDKGYKRGPYKASWSKTMSDLDRELGYLSARAIVIEMDIDESHIRLDGLPRGDAIPRTPVVIVSFGSKHGPLRYVCNTYTHWQQNLRAIAIGLQRLRLVDQSGISRRGEQYAGWKALPKGDGFATPQEAGMFIAARAGVPEDEQLGAATMIALGGDSLKEFYRRAARQSHPDHGGSNAEMARLGEAKRVVIG